MRLSGQQVLFLGAHPDDIELGCGALLAQISKEADILCVTLSDNQKNPLLSNVVREHYASMDILGVAQERIQIAEFETRNFPRDRQAILEFLYALNREHDPDMIFAHSQADMHQDHRIVTEEALRAFRGKTVLGFDVLRSSHGFFPDLLLEVSKEEADRKVEALAAYKTYADKYYFDPEVIRATLSRHGALAERPFAEGFDILRMVGRYGVL